MIKLSRSQLGLLQLCKNNPETTIEEMYQFAPLYEVSEDNLLSDYIILLSEHLLSPLGSGIEESYLPTDCTITAIGKQILEKISSEDPDRVPTRTTSREKISNVLRRHMDNQRLNILGQHRDDEINLPTFDELKDDRIAILADTYLHFAQINVDSPSTYRYELFIAACKGFARLKDECRFYRALEGGINIVYDSGEYLQLISIIHQLLKDYSAYSNFIVQISSNVLENIYKMLVNRELPKLCKKQELIFAINTIIENAIQIGNLYNFKLPHKNYISAIYGNAEKIIKKSFEQSNQELYHLAIELNFLVVKQAKSMIGENNSLDQIERTLNYYDKVELAIDIFDFLYNSDNLVTMNESKDKALELCLELINLARYISATPIFVICGVHGDIDVISMYWTFELLKNSIEVAETKFINIADQINELTDVVSDIHLKALSKQNKTKCKISDSENDFVKRKELEELFHPSDSKNDFVRRKDLEELLHPLIGKHQLMKGQLTEGVVCEYFAQLGYEAKKSSNELDHQKVDILAQNENDTIYVQVKSGQISFHTIRKFLQSIEKLRENSPKISIAAIVAAKFPKEAEIMRERLQRQYGFSIWFIHAYQILSLLPQYNRTLK